MVKYNTCNIAQLLKRNCIIIVKNSVVIIMCYVNIPVDVSMHCYQYCKVHSDHANIINCNFSINRYYAIAINETLYVSI